MKKLIFSLFSIFILLALPLQANEIDMSILNDLEIPTIVGPDDREEITGKAVGPEKAVVVTKAVLNQEYYGICSGAMVAPNIVLTAAHCLVDKKGNYKKGVTVYATGLPWETAFYPYAKAKALWVPNQYRKKAIIDNDTLNQNREKYDYGIIVLDKDLCKEEDCSVGMKALTDEELENANIVAIGRGGDKNCYSLWKSPGQIGKVKKYYIYHNADIVEGNSGGPIFKDDDPKNIIALQKFELTYYSSIRHYPNVGLRIRQEMIDDFNKVKNGELKAHSLPDTE